jgi:hypothetical protein
MEGGACPEQAAVGGEKWTIVLDGKSQVQAVPQGHPVPQGEVESAMKPETRIE